MKDVTIELLTETDLVYLFENLRKEDRAELQAWHMNELRMFLRFAKCEYAFVGKYQGRPVVAFGGIRFTATLHVWFFGTDEVEQFWLSVHRVMKTFLPWVSLQEYDARVLVLKWMKSESLKWLERIGFRPVNRGFRIGTEEFQFFEYEVIRI